MSNKALEGIKVLEYATEISGPYCGKLFADLGADVIKIEPPEGDPTRLAGPFPENKPHPEKSALFLYLNTSKKGMMLDIKKPEDLNKFKELIEWADLLIDNHRPEHLEEFGLGWETIQQLNPALVYTSITPYGRTGRRAGYKGDELTLLHAGGLANLLPARSTDVDRPPVKLGGNQVGYNGGIYSALASLSAIIGQRKTGNGQLIDISLHEVVCNLIFMIASSCRYEDASWCRVPDRPPALGRMQTSDGYVTLSPADDHHFRKLRELIGKPKWAESDEWDDMHYRLHHLNEIAPMMEEWMLGQKMEDIFHKAAKVGIPIAPLYTAKEVMEDPQYEARGYFVEVDHPEAKKYKYAGWPYQMTESPPQVNRPAPLLGQHNEEILKDIFKRAPSKQKISENNPLPLQGIRVLDFSWVVAGPLATRLLADLGAEVIKIEGHKRFDLGRRPFAWPLPEPEPIPLGINQGMMFNWANLNKKSLTLDLSKLEGIDLAKRLVAISDVVIDNMRPDAMQQLGLGYEDLVKIQPDIIVLQSSSRGRKGPQSHYLGFAVIHQSLGGLAYISGHPDGHPTYGPGVDADIMNAATTAFSLAAAIFYRTQTGKGQYVDFSQTEGVSALIGEILLGYLMTSEVPERKGNTHPIYAPHSVYRCWGVDRWLALEIHTDEEFKKMTEIINMPELASDPRFIDMSSRKANESELDQIIGAWIRKRDRDLMVEEFCRAGLIAAPSRDDRDLYADRHLREREAIVTIDHPELGEFETIRSPWKMSGFKQTYTHAPLLGQHNEDILKNLLNLSENEISDLREKEIISSV